MTFEQVVEQVREKFYQADVSHIQGRLAIQFNMTGEGEGAFYAEAQDGKLSIEPYEYYDRDVLLTMSADDLLRMMNKKLDPIFAFTVGRLKVDGDIDKALEIVKLM